MQETGSAPPAVRLYAVDPQGARPLLPRPGAEDVHELLDDQPLGIYEGMRTFGPGRLLGLERHMDRADRSMQLLGWSDRIDRPALRRALRQALAAWPAGDARVRFDVLEAPPRGFPTDSRVLLALSPHDDPSAATLRDGVKVGVAWTKRRVRPRIKQARWVIERRGTGPGDRGFFEHLLVDEDDGILECSSANFFAVRHGVLLTAGSGMLEGVTRGFVLELAEAMAISVELRAPKLADIGGLDEAFLTSASRNCIPVVGVEGRPVGAGRPGPLTAALRRAYQEMAQREAAPPLP